MGEMKDVRANIVCAKEEEAASIHDPYVPRDREWEALTSEARRRYARKHLRRIRAPYGRRPSTRDLRGGRAGAPVRDYLRVTQTVSTWPIAATAEAEIRSQWVDLDDGEDHERADHLSVVSIERRECPMCGGTARGGAATWGCNRRCREVRDAKIERLKAAGLCIFCEGTGCGCAELHLCPTCRGPRALKGGKWGCSACWRASGRRGPFPVVRDPTTSPRADNAYEADVARVAQVGIALHAMAAEERWRLRLRALLVYAVTPLTHGEVADLANEESWQAARWTVDRVRYAVEQAGTELLRRLRELPFGRPKGRLTRPRRPPTGHDTDETQLRLKICEKCGIKHAPGTPHRHPACEQCDIRHSPPCPIPEEQRKPRNHTVGARG